MCANNPQTTPLKNFNRVTGYNEGLRVYLFDDSLQVKPSQEPASAFLPGDLLAYELRQDDEICVDLAVRPPLTPDEMAQIDAQEPLSGFLCLATGRLCVEWANNFRFDPECDGANEDCGTIIQVPPGHYRVWIYHIDMDAKPADEQYEHPGPLQMITLEPIRADEIPTTGCVVLPFPRRKKKTNRRKKKPDTSWSGQYTLENDVFTGMFVHNYDVSGPCINFDRHAQNALALTADCRVSIEFESARIIALFLGNADEINTIRNHTKCGFITDREGIEKLMLFEFPDRDMMHFDFRKKPLYGTTVRIRRID